ncbi:MAG: hypothetical protein KF850_16790 [Labilithrix sp.]|nr:hypothetical protein [Labilithrix sp.]
MKGSKMDAGAAAQGRKARRRGPGMLVPIGFLVLFFGGISAAGFLSFRQSQRYQASVDGFLNAARAGEIDEAYQGLSPRRRASMPLAAFRSLAEHRALRRNRGHSIDASRTVGGSLPADRACVRARLDMDDVDWLVQLYVVRGDDGSWRVESFALHEVATVVLSDVLEECGYAPRRVVGYSGPPIVHRTPRLR